MPSSSTVNPFSIAPLRRGIELAFSRPLIPIPSFLVSDNETPLLRILSLSDISVVLSGIHNHRHHPYMQMTLILKTTPMLVLGA